MGGRVCVKEGNRKGEKKIVEKEGIMKETKGT